MTWAGLILFIFHGQIRRKIQCSTFHVFDRRNSYSLIVDGICESRWVALQPIIIVKLSRKRNLMEKETYWKKEQNGKWNEVETGTEYIGKWNELKTELNN